MNKNIRAKILVVDEKSEIIAQRIRRNIANHIFLGREGYKIRLTACIGVSTYPDDARTYKKLIDYADKAMYIGKNENRNVVHFADEMRKK
jgi:diguanylate cyclase (GGDEF)-like protein